MTTIPWRRHLRRWHRRVGLIAALPVLCVTLTGIIANHAPWLELDHQPVRNVWLLKLYGLEAPSAFTGYALGEAWLAIVADSVFINQEDIGDCALPPSQPLQVLRTGGEIYLGCRDSSWVISPAGELIEHSDLPLAALLPADSAPVAIHPQTLPADMASALQRHWHVPELHWERLLLDAHSGRLFGTAGERVVDLSGIALVWLTLSGIWVTTRRARP